MTSKPNQKENNSETDSASDEKAKKEELIEARMRMIRKKNEELMRRQREIEEDRKNADMYSEMAVKKNPGSFPSGVNKEVASTGLGRGRGRGLMLREMRKETLKAKQWEAKRRENIQKEEEERKKKAESSNPATRFLLDSDRVDMSKTSGRNEQSWGGANFNQVVNRVQREKEGLRSGRNKGNIELTMSGKERREYSQWKEERSRIDEERKARQKKTGSWSRAWDQSKSWDSRKKMWVNENHDDNNFRNTRRRDSDDPDDWGSDNRNRKRDHGQQEWDRRGPRSNSRLAQHNDHEVWGETGGKKVVAHIDSSGAKPVKEEDWGDISENKSVEQSSSGRIMAFEEDRGDDSNVNRKDINHTDPANGMPATEGWGKIKESKVTEDTVSERILLTDEKCDKITKEALAEPKALGSTTEEAVISHPHDKTISNPSLSEKQRDELSTTESKEIYNTPMEGNVVSHSVDGTITHKSGAEKAHLPKINTKVEKKVTFDPEENENVKETNVEGSTSLNIGDIPPTPDFLKIDHSLNWGDIDVDAEESEAILEPKW